MFQLSDIDVNGKTCGLWNYMNIVKEVIELVLRSIGSSYIDMVKSLWVDSKTGEWHMDSNISNRSSAKISIS